MEYMGNLEFWEGKFKARGEKALNAEPILVASIELLKGSTVLDIACGDGRNSIFLLEHGFKVTGVDFSAEALKRLKTFGEAFGDDLKTLQLDMTQENCFMGLGKYDNVIVCHYRLNSIQLRAIDQVLTTKGILLITGFSEAHTCDHKIRINDLIHKQDIKMLMAKFTLVKEEHQSDTRGNFVTYILQKK